MRWYSGLLRCTPFQTISKEMSKLLQTKEMQRPKLDVEGMSSVHGDMKLFMHRGLQSSVDGMIDREMRSVVDEEWQSFMDREPYPYPSNVSPEMSGYLIQRAKFKMMKSDRETKRKK